MTKPQTTITRIPFMGFYESWYSSEIDRQEEYACDNWEESERDNKTTEHLVISGSEYADLLMKCSSYSIMFHRIAKAYADAFNLHVSEVIGFDLRLTFESMSSPREYNFETDRLFVHIPVKTVRLLFAMSRLDGHKKLSETIARRHTSRSGFISYYNHDLASWLAKPLRDWDHNEIETLLIACFESRPDYEEDWDYRVFDTVADGDGIYQDYEAGVDWEKLESEIAELRADKDSEFREANPDFDDSEIPPPRCQFTIDMFLEWLPAQMNRT